MYYIIFKILLIYLGKIKYGVCCAKYLVDLIEKTQCDTRTDVYIAVTGLFVALVIFIAGMLSENTLEIYKDLMLKRTKIINIIRFVIITLMFIWIGEIIESSFLNIIVQLLIDIMIIISAIKTFEMFVEVIRLNTSEEYFDKKLYEYIYDEVKENSNKKEKQDKIYKNMNFQFEDFINKSKIFKYEKYPYFLDDSYNIIEANNYGYIKSYDYFLLKKIEDSLLPRIDNSNRLDSNAVTELPEIYLCKEIGDKCNKNFPIAYYKNATEKYKYINLISKAIIIDSNSNVDTQISKIIDNIFEILNQNISEDKDNNIISNSYEYFCRNKYENIIAVLLNKISNLYVEYIYNKIDNERFSKLLIKLSMIAIRYARYEDYKMISSYLTELYIQKTKFEDVDIKDIAYRYANNVFLLNKYALIRKKEYKYYDVMMANLFIMIKAFIRRKNFDAIFVLFDNISFDRNEHYGLKEFDKLDIIYFQFIISIIYTILYSYKKEEEKEIDDKYIKDIFDIVKIIKNEFFYFYDLWDVIIKFNKYANKDSEINSRSRDIDFNNENHRYKNSWTWSPIDKDEVLKCLIYMFEIDFYNINDIDENLITREDKYKYESLMRIMERKSFPKLEEKFNYETKYKENVINLLSEIIKIEEDKELEFEKKAEIDNDKIEEFKKTVIDNSKYESNLEKFLESIGNKKVVNEKISICLGINKLLPRNWFIKDDVNNIYTNHIAEDFGKAFSRGLKQKILNIIKENSIEKEDLENIVKSITNIEDYVLLINTSELHKFNRMYDTKEIEISGRKIKIISSFEIEETILINKNSFPVIEICEFDENYLKENIVDNEIYIEIRDCSRNETLIKEIIEKNKWLREKGDLKAQEDYLKTICEFKVYKPYRISKPVKKESYIIKNI